jgi:predicted glutamine amidotransferase
MARLFGYLANQADRLACALAEEKAVLRVDQSAVPDGWGIGFYQAGEVLLRKRPLGAPGEVDFLELTRDVRSDALIGHVRAATVGNLRQENTHPFRYRQWLFAHQGTVERFVAVRGRILESMPEFLRRNIRGDTDSEHLFHLFLAFLFDSGKLEDVDLDVGTAVDAMRTCLTLLDRIVAEVGGEHSGLNVMATNGRLLIATRRGRPLHIRRRHGIKDCTVCRPLAERSGRTSKPVDHDTLRYVIVASEAPEITSGWEEVPEGSIVGVRRDLETTIDRL